MGAGSKNSGDRVSMHMSLTRKHWPKNADVHLMFGKMEVRKLSVRLKLNERDRICGFHQHLIEKRDTQKWQHLKHALRINEISSRERVLGFCRRI